MSTATKGSSGLQAISRLESLYRVACSDGPNGGFIRDAASGKLLVTVEQFAPAVGGGYSCNLVSTFVKHRNDPWSVLSSIMPGKDPNLPRDSILRFEAKVLNYTPTLEAFIKTAAVQYDLNSKESNPSANQTKSCSHVDVRSSDKSKITEEDKHRFVEAINLWGWTLIAPGSY